MESGLLRATHQGTSRVATRKLSSEAGQPTITLRTFLDGTDDGGGIQSRAVLPKKPRTPGARISSALKELQSKLPSCSERAAVYVAPGVSQSLYEILW
jgi:hypothetical protein